MVNDSVDKSIIETTKKIVATVNEIKTSSYSYATLLFVLMVSISLNIAQLFFYHAQKAEYQQRESILVSEKTKQEYPNKSVAQNKQGEFAHCEIREGKNGEQPYYICR